LVHRPSTLKPAGRTGGATALPIALAALELAWLAWFLVEPLPGVGNAGGRGLTRADLLMHALPAVVPGVGFRDSHLGVALDRLSHVGNLAQRLPIVLASGFIAASAIAMGSLILRALGLRRGLDRWERTTLAFGLGTSALGLGTLVLGRLGLLHPWAIRAALAVPIATGAALAIAGRKRSGGEAGPWPDFRAMIGFAAVAGPFLALMTLGAMLPAVEFDATEYHLQGPKEYYRAGRIAFLPHNVYTSMPFGVEMLHLIGMEVVDDWWLGALVGQLLVASFAPATAVMIALAALRLGSPRAAWVAAVAYLTTPWVYRLGVLPFVEGPLCFYHAALIWAIVRVVGVEAGGPGPEIRRAVSIGLLAGGAMAIKYPALISAVLPASAWATLTSWRLRTWRVAAGFAVGVVVVAGPWLAKNAVDTGNPVYPLGYSVFGGRHWDAAREARWSAAHGPRPIEAAAFARSVVDVAGRSDWQSPLYLALAPLAFLRLGSRHAAGWLLAFVAYLFLTWWLLTHRLDRFWMPMLPPLAILAGLGADWSRSRSWSVVLGGVLMAGIGANAVYCSTELAGPNYWTEDLDSLRGRIPGEINPSLARLDAELPPDARPLLVGQAGVFHVDHPVVYNTVFDDDTFEGIARGRTPGEVREGLTRLGVTHVYVDWSEIERYRSAGNYGFTPYITPELFRRLVDAGVLRRLKSPGPRQDLFVVAKG